MLEKKCDNCHFYTWYYDYCQKWDCEKDARSVCDNFEVVNPESKEYYFKVTPFVLKTSTKLENIRRGDNEQIY